jgi:hypothetical protein
VKHVLIRLTMKTVMTNPVRYMRKGSQLKELRVGDVCASLYISDHASDRSQDQLSTDLRFVGLRRCADTVDVLIVADHCPKAGKHGVPCMHRRRCTLHVWGQSMASSAPHWLRRRTHRERDTGASRNGEHVPTGAIGGVVLEDT